MSKQSNQQPFLQIFGQNSEKFVKHPKELFFDYLHIFLKQKITVKKFQESFVFNLKNNNIIVKYITIIKFFLYPQKNFMFKTLVLILYIYN